MTDQNQEIFCIPESLYDPEIHETISIHLDHMDCMRDCPCLGCGSSSSSQGSSSSSQSQSSSSSSAIPSAPIADGGLRLGQLKVFNLNDFDTWATAEYKINEGDPWTRIGIGLVGANSLFLFPPANSISLDIQYRVNVSPAGSSRPVSEWSNVAIYGNEDGLASPIVDGGINNGYLQVFNLNDLSVKAQVQYRTNSGSPWELLDIYDLDANELKSIQPPPYLNVEYRVRVFSAGYGTSVSEWSNVAIYGNEDEIIAPVLQGGILGSQLIVQNPNNFATKAQVQFRMDESDPWYLIDIYDIQANGSYSLPPPQVSSTIQYRSRIFSSGAGKSVTSWSSANQSSSSTSTSTSSSSVSTTPSSSSVSAPTSSSSVSAPTSSSSVSAPTSSSSVSTTPSSSSSPISSSSSSQNFGNCGSPAQAVVPTAKNYSRSATDNATHTNWGVLRVVKDSNYADWGSP